MHGLEKQLQSQKIIHGFVFKIKIVIKCNLLQTFLRWVCCSQDEFLENPPRIKKFENH